MTPDTIQRLRLLYSDSNWYEKNAAARLARRELDTSRTEDTAADLFDSILKPVLQLVRRKASEALIEKGSLTKNEVPLTEVPSNDDELPIKTLQLDFGSIRSFRSAEELRNEQAKHPEFQWPRRAADQLKRKELLILDLKRVNLRVEFADGVEFKIPIKGTPVPLAIEIGSNLEEGEAGKKGAEKDGSIELDIGHLRLWWDRAAMDLSVAFMEIPFFNPNLDIAVEVQGRDLGINIKRGGLIEYLVTSVLSNYGPCAVKFQNASCVNKVWGSLLKFALKKALGAAGIDKNADKEGAGTPLKISLKPKPAPELGSPDDVINECNTLKEMAEAVLQVDDDELDCEEGRREELIKAMADAELQLAKLEKVVMSRQERFAKAAKARMAKLDGGCLKCLQKPEVQEEIKEAEQAVAAAEKAADVAAATAQASAAAEEAAEEEKK